MNLGLHAATTTTTYCRSGPARACPFSIIVTLHSSSVEFRPHLCVVIMIVNKSDLRVSTSITVVHPNSGAKQRAAKFETIADGNCTEYFETPFDRGRTCHCCIIQTKQRPLDWRARGVSLITVSACTVQRDLNEGTPSALKCCAQGTPLPIPNKCFFFVPMVHVFVMRVCVPTRGLEAHPAEQTSSGIRASPPRREARLLRPWAGRTRCWRG